MKLDSSPFLPAGMLSVAMVLGTSLHLVAGVESVIVEKSIRYQQTNDTEYSLMQSVEDDPNDGGAFGFWAEIEGEDLDGLDAPVLTLPASSTFPSAQSYSFNDGVFSFDEDEQSWIFGVDGDGWGAQTQGEIDSYFPSGTYSISASGVTVSLNLSGDDYPEPLTATLTGGAWANGAYVIDPSKALSISLTPYASFGSHLDDQLSIQILDEDDMGVQRLYSDDPSTAALTYQIPAGTLQAGDTFWIELGGYAAVDVDDTIDDALQAAVYGSTTLIKVRAIAPSSEQFPAEGVSGWQFKGYEFNVESEDGPIETDTISGTASLVEKLPGLVYTLSYNNGSESGSIDLVSSGGSWISEEATSEGDGSTEYERLELKIVDDDTILISDSSTSYESDSRHYWADFTSVVASRTGFPTASSSDWVGTFNKVTDIGIEIEGETGGILSDSSDEPESFTLVSQGGGSYGVSASNGESLTLQLSGGRLFNSSDDTDPYSLYSDSDWELQNVCSSDRVYAILLNNGRIFVTSTSSNVGQLIPVVPANHEGWVPVPYLSYYDGYSTILEGEDSGTTTDFEDWTAELGLTGDDALPTATPFPDGLPNLVRYAMNLGADDDGSDEMKPSVVTESGETYVVLEFQVRNELTGVSLTPQISYDLTTWTDVPGAYITQIDEDSETTRYEIKVPADTGGGFLRLQASETD
ncbi:hypothetical protein JIN85_03425 [Luteolibacter pohnpeiensis]|uniref:Uncharacterized protein n=1 Tax=Luteolibacter pohnpeiensis TaxID=454153 RepID=A0A934VUS8_9BACT|nr:hypothetical protein [Luteolibacter pohnpeiensis]MBK1881450.1 hypothetical protein [Luteolibacter pohnpeiensis]